MRSITEVVKRIQIKDMYTNVRSMDVRQCVPTLAGVRRVSERAVRGVLNQETRKLMNEIYNPLPLSGIEMTLFTRRDSNKQ